MKQNKVVTLAVLVIASVFSGGCARDILNFKRPVAPAPTPPPAPLEPVPVIQYFQVNGLEKRVAVTTGRALDASWCSDAADTCTLSPFPGQVMGACGVKKLRANESGALQLICSNRTGKASATIYIEATAPLSSTPPPLPTATSTPPAPPRPATRPTPRSAPKSAAKITLSVDGKSGNFTVCCGSKVKVAWEATDAEVCSFPALQKTDLQGEVEVDIKSTTTFTVTCLDKAGLSVKKSITVRAGGS